LEGIAMKNLGLFYSHWKYFMAIWNILCSFGIHIVFPILVFCAKENLATLVLYKLGTVSVFRVSIP
jgi:hypothetical protein